MKKLLSLILLSTLTMSACSVDTAPVEQTPADDEVATTRTDNVFKFEGLEVGQQYGDMTIDKIAAFTSEAAMSEGNLKVNFTGTTELTGSYEYFDSNHEFWPNQACFRVKDETLAGLPVYMWFEDRNESFFCFENNDFALSELGFENKDNVKIVIDDYTANILEGEVVDWADLVEVK